ncbi:hypothetical protein CLPUN_38400 [Clostridium puniceum]|uniref:Fibronectin type-III domain-containing protein n=2 Tax=Clostridium puniceum TaxID=29367 RepID=A0A1S8TA34_9CLOT|nr:hypothetical protein CLPUN_38400 [Clostridium puniceum]
MLLFINQGYDVQTVYGDTSDWKVIDTSVSGTYLNDYINTKISNGDRKFYIKDGTYNLSDSITLNESGIIIYGESSTGTKIVQTNPNANSIVITQSNINISNFYIDGSQGREVFRAQNDQNDVHDVSIENCVIDRSKLHSAIVFLGDSTYKSINNSISGNIINTDIAGTLTEPDAITFYNQKDGIIMNNNIVGGRISFNLCKNSKVSDNNIKDSIIGAGIRATVPANNIEISNNTIENTKAAGIVVVEENTGDDDSLRYDGIKIVGNNVKGSQYFGIEVRNLENAIISDNVISEIGYEGIYLLYSDNTMIKNNSISNYGQSDDNVTWQIGLSSAVFLDFRVKNSDIMDNIIYNDNIDQYGIRIQDGAENENNTIYNNNISGNFKELIHAKVGALDYTKIIETSATEDSIKISWDEVDAAIEYEVEVDGKSVPIDVGTDENYENTGLNSNSIHKYRIRIKGGQWSGIITEKTLSSQPPVVSVPQNIKTSATENSIKISWDEVDAATEYEVEVDGESVLIDVGADESYENTGLNSNSIHKYRIRIKGGQWSGIITEKTLSSQPPVVSVLQNIKTSATENSIKISWDEVDAATEYEVEVDENLVLIDVGADESYENTGLNSNSTHKYRIRIKGGQWSGIITEKTLSSQPPVVSVPQNIKTSATENSIKISWDEVDDAKEYEVEIDGDSHLIDVGTDESHDHIGLLSNSTHNYRVRIKGGQWSDFITSVTLSSQSPIAIIPQNIKAATTGSSIQISWDEVEATTEYEIEVDGTIVLVGTKESYKHIGLKNNSKHKYRVRIKDGQWSTVLIATTTKRSHAEEPKSIKKSRSKKHNSSISYEYDKIEMEFGSKILLIYQNKLIQNNQEDKLKRIILYTFEEKYYVRIKAWKNNEVKISKEYELYKTPKQIFTIDEIKNIVIDRNDPIETILVKDMDGYIKFMNIIGDSSLSKYSIEDGYIVSIDNLGMKVQNNQKCTKIID